ncbi:hypothetical protein [Companilactobacillus insicii]|uniref:hypothetical protein n=1 Tax=Companilactobacillus insicii TaxID=1732567 RepID=UPI000F78446C|nr:hypothetical protein [Companilactobacillus insicii]
MLKIVDGKLKLAKIKNQVGFTLTYPILNLIVSFTLNLIDGNELLDLDYKNLFFVTILFMIFFHLWNYLISKLQKGHQS